MPRRVVPIWRLPSFRSRAPSRATCHGMIRCALPERNTRPAVTWPRPSRSSSSSITTRGSTTQPAPIADALPATIPDGIWRILYVSPSTTIVCPAFGPPWYRQTRSECCASRSTILPLPSSPHCAPTITVAGTRRSVTYGPATRAARSARHARRSLRGSRGCGGRAGTRSSPGRARGARGPGRCGRRARPPRPALRRPGRRPCRRWRGRGGRPSGRPSVRRRQVGELRVALEEGELDRVRRAVAVLGQVHLGEALLVGLVVVVLVAVDEHHQVGVLLDRPGLAEGGEDRPLVVALLDRAGELRHGQDRDVDGASEHLRRPRDLRDPVQPALVLRP